METTLRELKAMLLEKHPRAEDPIERKLLAVELLRDSSIMEVDDAQTLGAAGLLEANAITTVIYKRNEVEAATKDGIHTREFFHLNIPSICTNISWQAFQDCTHLVSVAMNESSVTHIDECAFYGCTSLARITFGESVTHIKYNAFRKCKSLESLTLGDSVTHIENSAFEECSSLASITLGECVAHIGNSAFSGCTALQTITLGASVTYIGECAFQDCTSLTEHHFGWVCDSHIEGVCLSKLHLSGEYHVGWVCHVHWGRMPFMTAPLLQASLWVSLSRTLGTVRLSKLHLSGEHHFGWVCQAHWGHWLTSLASITLPFRNSAFYGCTSLASITLGESVRRIGECAFQYCPSLASITLGESVTAHRELCLFWLHLSCEHHFGWVCHAHWGRCLWRLHLSCQHHFGWVCHAHWERCLFWLHLSGRVETGSIVSRLKHQATVIQRNKVVPRPSLTVCVKRSKCYVNLFGTTECTTSFKKQRIIVRWWFQRFFPNAQRRVPVYE